MSFSISSDNYVPINYMISNKNLSCAKVSMHLKNVGIPGTVTSQCTVCCKDSNTNCKIEKGCLVTIYNTPLEIFYEKIVMPLQTEHSLNCGYVQINGVYTGCISNLFRLSNCKK